MLGGIGRIQGGGGSSGHGVGNALGEDVERQAGDHDGQAREQCLPPTAGEHAARVGEDVAPGSVGSWMPAPMKVSEASKMMASATENDGEDEDRGDAVAHDVLPESTGREHRKR